MLDVRSLGLHHQRFTDAEMVQTLTKISFSIANEIDLSHNHLNGAVDFWILLWNISQSVRRLILAHNQIKNLEISTKLLPFIQVLDLSHNALSELHEDTFNHMPNLRIVRLEGNRLRSLPPSLPSLLMLESLSIGNDLGGNFIKDFPSGMERLGHMRALIASNNRIRHFPSFIRHWPNVEMIKLDDNQIETLPELNISGLSKLVEVDLQSNHFEKLMKRIIWPLSLRVLNLCSNRIRLVSRAFTTHVSSNCTVLLADNPLPATAVQISSVISRPLTLLELAARTRIQGRHEDDDDDDDDDDKVSRKRLTPPLCRYLLGLERCALCPMRFLQPCAQVIMPCNVRGHTLPTEIPLCSPSCLARVNQDDLGMLTLDLDDN